jgi:selenocysteine-specific elongation factor
LALAPSANAMTARVRSIHAQNLPVGEAQAGQRCALGLVGIARDEISRGQWLVAPTAALATQRLDADLTVWHAEARPVRSGTPVHVHIGSAGVTGTLAVLDVGDDVSADAIAPGQRARVQIVLREPMAAWRGDRLVLRDISARRTLAGGVVLDPLAPTRYRRSARRFVELDAWAQPTAVARLAALIETASDGLHLRRWCSAEGLEAVPEPPLGTLLAVDATDGDWALGAQPQAMARQSVMAALTTYHERLPDELGPDAARLRRMSAPRMAERLWRALIAAMQAETTVVVNGPFVHLPEHGQRLSAADQRLAEKVKPWIESAGFEGGWARDLARDAGESEALMRTTLTRLARAGALHQVVKDLFYSTASIALLEARLREVVAAGEAGEATASAFRDATGLGRKRAIQVLEYFDRVGVLRRVGDVHRLRSPSPEFMERSP